jgi:hypothetical protein
MDWMRARWDRIYARWGSIFANLTKMGREDAKLLERVFSDFTKKIKDRKAGWQTIGDAQYLRKYCARSPGYYNELNLW